MVQSNLGEMAALVTAVCWTITAISFELAGRKIGSLSVNFIRLVMAFFLLGIFTLFTRGMFLPLDATPNAWLWLSISGIIGFVLGDLFLFQAFLEIGSRISMLIMSAVPPITALLGFFFLGEVLTPKALIGMFVTIIGIALVILVRKSGDKKLEFNHSIKGLLFAFIGALGQSLGLIFSKMGMGSYNAFAATQIRIIFGIIGFIIVFTFMKRWNKLKEAITNSYAMKRVSIGAFFGPFLGVSFSLLAVQYTATGIASTINSIVPVLIIIPSIIIFKEKVSTKEIIGAIVTVLGVGLLFI
ncbi:DMT family transporter [Sporosalibacterium faouarense]|uniref:DMT family transporter n=1 Tax=Sporosalibacterium faouarense TaxID=516123 RepID=UPI00141CEC24|nr:DMT family transporter [Sporosalibacterium faouarense]MTI46932.1 DMT family transporter [Bacillota bacterium]